MTKILDTDNRDVNTTVLKLDNGTEITVDPVELFRNALENAGLPSRIVSSIIDAAMLSIDMERSEEE